MNELKDQRGVAILVIVLLLAITIAAGGIAATTALKASNNTPSIAERSPSPAAGASGASIAPNATAAPPSQSPSAGLVSPQPSAPAPTPQAKAVTVLYNIAADGVTAQLSPVTTSVTTAGDIELTIRLTCAASCQFKLASDAYPLASSAIYSSSQTVKYTLTQHGTWYFYNEFIPNVKFGLKF